MGAVISVPGWPRVILSLRSSTFPVLGLQVYIITFDLFGAYSGAELLKLGKGPTHCLTIVSMLHQNIGISHVQVGPKICFQHSQHDSRPLDSLD